MITNDDLTKAINKRKRELWFEEHVKEPAKKIKDTAIDIWNNNKTEIVILTPIVLGGVKTLIRGITTNKKIKAEQNHRELDFYDNRSGNWYHLRKPLTTRQKLELERRKADGENTGAILSSMHLLKW